MQLRPSRLVLLGLWGLLLIAGSVVVDLPAPAAEPVAKRENNWVRTRDGWQRATWYVTPAAEAPLPHPAVTAAFLLMFCILALLALPARRTPAFAKAPMSADRLQKSSAGAVIDR